MFKKEMKDILSKNVMDYAKYTITDRAIVSLSDGMKNIHRRIMWSMYLDGLLYNKNRTKSVNAVGSVLRFSPHGDSSVYQACVRLANDSVMIPLIDGKGSFSSITTRDIQAGASRYTEMRLAPISQEILKDIDKNVVNMVNNYDDTRLEPTDLPVTFPLVLCNPSSGIAVGIASTICSFNLNDVINNTIKTIKNKETDIIVPDFPTAGLIKYDEKILKQIKDTGIGTVYLQAKYHVEDNSIVITEIPYTTTREAIIESVISLVKDNKIKEVVDVNDYSGVDGLNITIDIKKNTNTDLLMSKLYKLTPLRSAFSCNFTLLLDNKPVTLGVDNILKEWIKFRQSCVIKGIEYDVNKKSEQLHLLKGLEKVLLDIDKAIQIIRHSKSDELIISNLIKEFSIDEQQANDIANMKLKNINEQYILHKIKSIKDLEQEITELKNILNNDDKINDVIISQLEEVSKKYGQDRKTTILYEEDIQEISETQFIEEYNTICYLSKEGYFKKVPATSLRGSTTNKLKDGDDIIYTTESSNKSTILLFSNKAICYKLYQHEIDDCKLSNLGLYLPQQLQLDKDEQIISMVSTRKYTGYLIVAFNNGKIAKITMDSFKTKTMRSKLDNALNLESPMVNMFVVEKDIDLLLKSSIDKVLVTNTSVINSKASKNTAGNQIQKQKNNSITELCIPLSQIDVECIDIDYYKSESGKGIGNYLRKTDEIKLIK